MSFKELVDNNFKGLKAEALNDLFGYLVTELPTDGYQKRTNSSTFRFGKVYQFENPYYFIVYKGLSRLLNRAQITNSFKRWLRTAYVQTYRLGFGSAFDGTNPLGSHLLRATEIDFPIKGGIFNPSRAFNIEKNAYRQFMDHYLVLEELSYQRSLIKDVVGSNSDIETIGTSPKYLNPLRRRRAIWRAEFKARNNSDIEAPLFFTN